jgi:hypothetical protein
MGPTATVLETMTIPITGEAARATRVEVVAQTWNPDGWIERAGSSRLQCKCACGDAIRSHVWAGVWCADDCSMRAARPHT